MTDMTDEELKQFLRDNKDRIASLLAEDTPEKADMLHQIKDMASEMNDRIFMMASETKEKTEDVMKDMYSALMDSEAHRHFVRMGMEFFMGINRILEKAPIPKPVRKFQEDVAESKSHIQPELCKNNPDCALKKKEKELEKIDLD